MDIEVEKSYPTMLANSPLLPFLLMSLARQKNSPNTAKTFSQEYDYIIVGGGSAGSVVASRLSERPCVSVLLLEAGKPPPLLTDVPVLGRAFWYSDIDWTYLTAPQRHCGRGLKNRQVVWPSGKTLGGSSVLNFMLYVRGNKQNYNDWANQGAEGWSYKDVLPYFEKMEDNRNPAFANDGFHGTGGPVTVERPRYKSELKEPLFETLKVLGYKFVDPNGEQQPGIYNHQGTIRRGQRCSTAKAYLVPAENRTNLDILTNAMVRKVLIENGRCIGVEFDFENTTYKVKARREVIVSAGTVNTAQLLMLSGIGPKEELIRHGIRCLSDLPVGRNLQDHANANANVVADPNIPSVEKKSEDTENLERYIYNRTGFMASTEFITALAFLGDDAAKFPPQHGNFPLYELYFAEFSAQVAKRDFGMKPEVYEQVYGPYINKTLFTCFASLLQPKSRGTVTLRSANPYHPPIIDPNYFSDPRDVDVLVKGLKEGLKIFNSEPLRTKLQVRPFETLYPGCEALSKDQDSYLACQVLSTPFTISHQVGTAKMGSVSDPTTVVDPKLSIFQS